MRLRVGLEEVPCHLCSRQGGRRTLRALAVPEGRRGRCQGGTRRRSPRRPVDRLQCPPARWAGRVRELQAQRIGRRRLRGCRRAARGGSVPEGRRAAEARRASPLLLARSVGWRCCEGTGRGGGAPSSTKPPLPQGRACAQRRARPKECNGWKHADGRAEPKGSALKGPSARYFHHRAPQYKRHRAREDGTRGARSWLA